MHERFLIGLCNVDGPAAVHGVTSVCDFLHALKSEAQIQRGTGFPRNLKPP